MSRSAEHEIAELRREVEQQRRELQELRAQMSPSVDGQDADRPVTRRRLLGMAGAAAAGAGVAALSATPAGAVHQPEDIGIDLVNNGSGTTSLFSGVSGNYAFGAGNSAPANIGNIGAYGSSSNGGIGVLGEGATASGTGIGVLGRGVGGGGIGVQGVSQSGDALNLVAPTGTSGSHLRFEPHTSIAGPPTAGAHTVGQFWMDSNGVLFQCIIAGSGTSAKWARQSSLISLPAPFRVYDSRVGQTNPSGSTQGTLNFGAAARVINASPVPFSGSGNLPPTTTALLFNMTLASTVGAVGSVVLWANGASEPTTASITWTGSGVVVGSAVTSSCDNSQQVQMKCTTGSSTHVILDVIGFYV